jgi:excisionase family DNA binding protein
LSPRSKAASRLLSIAEAAEYLGVDTSTVRKNYIAAGYLNAVKIGWGDRPPGEQRGTYQWRIPFADVQKLERLLPLAEGGAGHR